jgi:hypothetical protein
MTSPQASQLCKAVLTGSVRWRPPCACPNDKDKAGHRCGKRSAFCQPGGAEISNCYLKDVEKRKKDACG